ncbi:MAG: hypothetical protein ATN35_05740 [Epulopiscium sp. Nele67-Bin004]|nr:MAG: hypothetical protein ATN35_05740 [Epulopiscium sp. Nele67-Bin004]
MRKSILFALVLSVFLAGGEAFAQKSKNERGDRMGWRGDHKGDMRDEFINKRVFNALPESIQMSIKELMEKSKEELKTMREGEKAEYDKMKEMEKTMRAEKDKEKAAQMAVEVSVMKMNMETRYLAEKQKIVAEIQKILAQ